MDKYQGQQNDYILLSLVRTRAVGHLRDVRRLVVATSRARLGLYVFGRRELFANCYELRPAMEQMTARPGQLLLHPVEHWEVSWTLATSELQGDGGPGPSSILFGWCDCRTATCWRAVQQPGGALA